MSDELRPVASRKRVTIVAHEVHEMGGMERAQATMVRGLLARGWTVQLLARYSELPPHPRLTWHRIRTPRRPFSLALPLFAAVAGAQLSRHRDGVVISLGAIVPNRVDAITVQFCHRGFRRLGLPRAVRPTLLRRVNDEVGSRSAVALERWAFRASRVRMLLPVAPPISRQLREHFDPAIPNELLANGVDWPQFRPDLAARNVLRPDLGLGERELVALFVGGDWERKGLRVAIDAAARAGWTLLVVGVGDAESYARHARTAGARVIFTGRRDDAAAVYATADAFVLPSAYEGFALVTLEAASSGLPVITTAASGAGALIEAGGGVLVTRDADAVAAALGELDDSEVRSERGREARAAAASFDWQALVDQYERVLLSLGERPTASA